MSKLTTVTELKDTIRTNETDSKGIESNNIEHGSKGTSIPSPPTENTSSVGYRSSAAGCSTKGRPRA